MKTVIAGDIGGTNTRLQAVQVEPTSKIYHTVFEREYSSHSFSNFHFILTDFIEAITKNLDLSLSTTDSCFAIAGPISSDENGIQVAKVTNLPWTIENKKIKDNFGFSSVRLINDFEAIAHGLITLTKNDFFQIQKGLPINTAPKIIIGAGTGLGVCQVIYHPTGYCVIPSEGGHCDFAPNNEQQIELLKFLLTQYTHLSYDRLLSGQGIENIFSFISANKGQCYSNFIDQVNNAADPAASISNAFSTEPLARETITLFMSIYGAQAGNLALTNLAYGGVFLAGGIAPKLIEQFQLPNFLDAFKHKGRMSALMSKFPISIIVNTGAGIRGAAVIAGKAGAT